MFASPVTASECRALHLSERREGFCRMGSGGQDGSRLEVVEDGENRRIEAASRRTFCRGTRGAAARDIKTVGQHADGTAVAVGYNDDGQCDVFGL